MRKTAMVATVSGSLLTGTPSAAVGAEAVYIRKVSQKAWQAWQTSNTFGYSDLLSDLAEMAEQCSVPDWDGQGAAPVRPETVLETIRFIQALPLGTARPTIGSDPDGQITLEWYESPRSAFSVSVNPAGELHYAALLGSRRQYGTEPFLGEVPTVILDLIRRVSHK
jgi:hypothetical protein